MTALPIAGQCWIQASTLVIGLGRDHVIPPERVRALHHAIPGSAHAELDSGDLVVFERPEELVSIVRELITGDAVRRG